MLVCQEEGNAHCSMTGDVYSLTFLKYGSPVDPNNSGVLFVLFIELGHVGLQLLL